MDDGTSQKIYVLAIFLLSLLLASSVLLPVPSKLNKFWARHIKGILTAELQVSCGEEAEARRDRVSAWILSAEGWGQKSLYFSFINLQRTSSLLGVSYLFEKHINDVLLLWQGRRFGDDDI